MHAIEALIRCIAMGERCREVPTAETPIIMTVSTAAGAGGKEVAQRLAERLQVGFFDKHILNAVAEETHTDRQVLERLDERVDGMKGAWLRSLLTGENLFRDTFRRNLINVILGIGCKGGVILGRGANFILAHRPVLRIRVVGSAERCAQRIAKEQGITLSAAHKIVQDTDRDRAEFIRTFYRRQIDDPLGYDLVVNSDRLADEGIADIALLALERIRCTAPEPIES